MCLLDKLASPFQIFIFTFQARGAMFDFYAFPRSTCSFFFPLKCDETNNNNKKKMNNNCFKFGISGCII